MKQLSNQFHLVIIVIFTVVLGTLGFLQAKTQQELNKLQAQPQRLQQALPLKVSATPTATPSATVTPTKALFRVVPVTQAVK